MAYRDKMKKIEEEKQEKFKSFTNYDDSDFNYFGDLFKDDYQEVLEYEHKAVHLKDHDKENIKIIFDTQDTNQIIANTNQDPDLIFKLSDCQLDYIIACTKKKGEKILKGLNNSTIRSLMKKKKLIQKLDTFSHETIVKLINCRPMVITEVDPIAKPFVQKLLGNIKFVEHLKIS